MSAPTKKIKKIIPNPQSPTDIYDIVPTMMELMGLEKPAEMTGESLLIKK